MEEAVSLGMGKFAIYDCASCRFTCSYELQKLIDCGDGGVTVEELNVLSEKDRRQLNGMLLDMASLKEPCTYQAMFQLRTLDNGMFPYLVHFVCDRPGEQIVLSFQPLNEVYQKCPDALVNRLTGLMTRELFLERLQETERNQGAVVYFDVQHFKMINNIFGIREGDRLLQHIASSLRANLGADGFACQLSADRFVFYIRASLEEAEQCVDKLFDEIAAFELPFEILCNAGIYMWEDGSADAGAALDGAIMAQEQVKGNFSRRFHVFSQELQESLIGEHEITGMMRAALKNRQFIVYYQPQYDHSTGMMVGAEALVRWTHPEKGLISPAVFIPVFERTGLISQLDKFVFEEICAFQAKCIEEGISQVPISVNLTRYDLFTAGFLDELEAIRVRYNVPPGLIRIEITESSALGNSRFINDALKTLHDCGYIVEMDDFGSGYSSLNVLKDINFDVIKLDMKFFDKSEGMSSSGRGGTILSSIVRMVNWLQLPLIAEGVETVEQADFLQSIGCDYIQGYLYSKPLPSEEYRKRLLIEKTGSAKPELQLIETMDAQRFWSAESLETLIFSNYVGGAAIFNYNPGGSAEILRVNRKYLQELHMNLEEKDVVNKDILSFLDEAGQMKYRDMLDNAIASEDERECETWRTISSSTCGEDKICVRSTVRVIGHSKGHYIFYAMIRNVTAEKRRWIDIMDNERRFKAASEQVNIYYWEYTVATHEMRPCFRCMRDLGLPALLTNYPESAIEMGVFPPEIADEYREWHRKIDTGEAKSLEAVMPLTVGRVPFHVRYTTEFDKDGHPVKAYGSAALVVD